VGPCVKVIKKSKMAGHWWFTPVILTTQRQRSGGSRLKAREFTRPYLEKTPSQKRLVEWL
jgi:hypothetical protein